MADEKMIEAARKQQRDVGEDLMSFKETFMSRHSNPTFRDADLIVQFAISQVAKAVQAERKSIAAKLRVTPHENTCQGTCDAERLVERYDAMVEAADAIQFTEHGCLIRLPLDTWGRRDATDKGETLLEAFESLAQVSDKGE